MEEEIVNKQSEAWKEAHEATEKAFKEQGTPRRPEENRMSKTKRLINAASSMFQKRKDDKQQEQASTEMTISQIIADMPISGPGSSSLQQALEERFAEELYGVVVFGIQPEGKKHLEPFEGGGLQMPFVTDPEGRPMIKLCSDPEIFSKRFPNSFNAAMTGKEAMNMARKVPDAAGLLVCSALAFKSVPIYKEEFDRYLQH